MTQKPLDLGDAAKLLANDDRQKKERAITGRSKKAIVFEPRTYDTWFKIPTHFGVCTNPECPDARKKKVEEGVAMVGKVNGTEICRLCFLAGVNPTTL